MSTQLKVGDRVRNNAFKDRPAGIVEHINPVTDEVRMLADQAPEDKGQRFRSTNYADCYTLLEQTADTRSKEFVVETFRKIEGTRDVSVVVRGPALEEGVLSDGEFRLVPKKDGQIIVSEAALGTFIQERTKRCFGTILESRMGPHFGGAVVNAFLAGEKA